MSKYSKWVSFYGNAMSITENKPAMYAKDITLRYPLYCAFNGDKLRLTLDNYCGTEAVTITRTTVMVKDEFYDVYFGGKEAVTIKAGAQAVSDEVAVEVEAKDTVVVSFYLSECTQMRSSVYAQGPLSKGQYSLGDRTRTKDFDINISRKTNIFYFLSNASIYTEEENHALICYGDSITAQDWPDYLALMCKDAGILNVSVIRRATSGSRILREYSCITYESYGLKAENRFNHEIPQTDGADTIIIQQGINDIIHPVGIDVNPFRPMSDLPTVKELEDGLMWYIKEASRYNLTTYVGTLLPINGWRTYADFREKMKNEYNDFIRDGIGFKGVVDFDKAVRDEDDYTSFFGEYDSGDHLHPSDKGYERMAKEAFKILF